MVTGAVIGAVTAGVPALLKFFDRRSERKSKDSERSDLLSKGLFEKVIELQEKQLEHDTASAAKVEWGGWGTFLIVARSLVRPAVFYGSWAVFITAVVAELSGNNLSAATWAIIHEQLAAGNSFYGVSRGSEVALGRMA